MTNINCSANCIYQRDGKCFYNIVSMSGFCGNSECAYYIPYHPKTSKNTVNNK